MHTTETDTDTMSATGETPDVAALMEEYSRAWSANSQWLTDIASAEDIRYTRWAGQSGDGLKHQELLPQGQRALPYDLAPDCRVPLADEITNAQVDVLFAAFWGARMNAKPSHVSKLTAQQAAEWRSVVSWIIHGPLKEKLIDDVEFCSQLTHTIGWCVLHPCWKTRHSLKLQKLSMEGIIAMANVSEEGSILAALPNLILDPELEDSCVQLLQQYYPHLKKARARRVVRELRESDDHTAEFPVPYVAENAPDISVLIPGQDIVLPAETTDLQNARVIFRRVFMSEADLKAMELDDDWAPEFIEAALKTKGNVYQGQDSEASRRDDNSQLIEIVHAYARGNDDDGVPGIWCTVFSPNAGKGPGEESAPVGKHYLLDYAHGKYPFLIYRSEVVGRKPEDSRGVPSIVVTQQMQLKKQRDACAVFAEMNTTPPLLKKGARASKLPPELGPLGIINVTTDSEWSKMDLAGEPKMALIIEDKVRAETENYFGIPRVDSVPSKAQTRQQRLVHRWLMTWGQALWQLSVLTYQNLSPEEMQELLGRQPMLSADELLKQNINLWFDVRSLDNDWVKEMFAQIIQVLSVDSGGVVDRSKLMGILLAYLDPTLADEVTMDQAGAAQAVFEKVNNDLLSIMNGNEAVYVENDPTAKMKIQFAQQIVQNNPDYLRQLSPRSPQFNERKAMLFEKYMANLQQSVAQEENKKVGRIGVNPATPMAGAMSPGPQMQMAG